MSYMFKEISHQPDAIISIVNKEKDRVYEIGKEIKDRKIRFILLAARGTSDHSAVYGKYLFEINNRYPVGLADPSVVTIYDAAMDLSNCLVIGVSQSGGSVDINEYLEHSKRCGAMTICITNEHSSEITHVTDHAIFCDAGKEKSVAATKTYTTSLAAFYLLSQALADNRSAPDSLLGCAEAMRTILDMDSQIKERAERYRYAESTIAISRGLNYCTALEVALKLAETCYMKTRGFSAADLMHGPIASVHEDDPCIIIAPPGKAEAGMREAALSLNDKNAETIIFSSDDVMLSTATVPFKMPIEVDEELSPLAYVLPGQLFAYHLSITKGNDPDNPHGLSKVTITR